MPEQRYLAFALLSYRQQRRARERFSPFGRRDGWENIERWAFPVHPSGVLVSRRVCRFIEPAYTLAGAKIPEMWEPLP